MSELIDKLEEVAGGILQDHERNPVADPALISLVKAGEEILSPEHLNEIKGRRAVADIDTLIGACEKFLELLSNYGWGPAKDAESAEEPSEPEAPAEEPAAPAEPEAPAEGEET